MTLNNDVKKAIVDLMKERQNRANYGMLSHYRVNESSWKILSREGIRLNEKCEILKNGEVIGKVRVRYSIREVCCCNPMLTPKMNDIVIY